MSLPVLFGSIAINESRFIADSIAQHGDYCQRWFIVEGADQLYRAATTDGFSIDGQETAALYAAGNDRVTYTRHGWAENKSELRNAYADAINRYLEAIFVKLAIVIVIDIDEFLCRGDLHALLQYMQSIDDPSPGAIRIPHVHYWRNPMQIITGKYYDIPHDRVYFWPVGARYGENHNHPVDPTTGRLLQELRYERHDRHLLDRRAYVQGTNEVVEGKTIKSIAWHHFGFARAECEIASKNNYYVARGEAKTRPDTTESRAAFFDELKTGKLPDGCQTFNWLGPWPDICLANRQRWGIEKAFSYRDLKLNRTTCESLW